MIAIPRAERFLWRKKVANVDHGAGISLSSGDHPTGCVPTLSTDFTTHRENNLAMGVTPACGAHIIESESDMAALAAAGVLGDQLSDITQCEVASLIIQEPPKVHPTAFLIRIRMIIAEMIARDSPYLRKLSDIHA